MSQIDSARTVVVRTAADWAELWKEHTGTANPPAVDFTRTMVVAVFAGMRPSGGYAVEITQIEKTDAAIVVTYRERKPGPDDITTQALTFPFHIVRTDAHAGDVTFRPAR
ncbi:MAG TPA: protease complex subunit PrcB family protein [Vicinamibacterales bacterium]|nr:protease complex subunit PrcB family protein [Vicinamibacterales bacterium]